LTYQSIAGLTAAALGATTYIVYTRDVLRTGIRPNRASWIIWAVVNWITAFSYVSSGASWSSCIVFVFAVGTTFLGTFSLFKGEGGVNRFDIGCLLAAAFCILLWISTSSPLPALVLSLVTNCVGTFPTARKLWLKAGNESIVAWTMWTMSNLINVTAILTSTKAAVIVPPIYFSVQCAILVALVWRAQGGIRPRQTKPD
jgi:hypothetical protein